jgi:hypothetical protein
MKDKAIEIRDRIFKPMSDYTELHEIQEEILQAMLEFSNEMLKLQTHKYNLIEESERKKFLKMDIDRFLKERNNGRQSNRVFNVIHTKFNR